MTQPTIYSADQPGGRPATDAEIAAVLGPMTALDGTNYLDMWNASQPEGDDE